MDALDARCLDSMGLLAGTPDTPYIIPPDDPTPLDRRAFLCRATPPSVPETDPRTSVNEEIQKVNTRLNSIEGNITEILSYLNFVVINNLKHEGVNFVNS